MPVEEGDNAAGGSIPNQWWRGGGGNGSPGNGGNTRGGRGQGGNLKAKFQAHKGQIKQYLMHLFKAFVPKEAAEKWFSLTREARQCLTNAQQALGVFYMGGVINTEEDWISRLKQTCPDVSTEIDAWHAECVANRAAHEAEWTENFNKLPQSVRDVFTKLNETFDSLRRAGTFLARDKEAIKTAFLPVLQQFIAVPQSDWDQVAQAFPKTEFLLGSNGNLTSEFFVLVKAAEEYLRTGTVSNKEEIQQAKQAFKDYGKQMWKQWAPVLKQKFQETQEAPEQTFSPQVEAELDNSIDESLNGAEESAPAVEAHILPAAAAQE